ncbi:PhaM family polyhydroxyalkanoate granule multifunctional regulatory protein [Comamonas antarctica]|uniref:Uncharacterized protein n=1 Tax=Comamonas antarctica TaxID=2743470 RepID=A0A6N1X541_9BURK|nr:PhaM family polyhydroxyalkanoate granule multifunctional regulatory protein [Comamonas antarctica]QKV54549.1 hypothetical protein HUK68_17560 [Comamonas antarctica]
MSNSGGTDPFGFGRFIPGFEFLQGMSQAAAGAAAVGAAAPGALPGGAGLGAQSPFPGMSQWIAPTVSIEDIDKRIQELRAVQFWIEQNGRALTATIQALEVQKMTLAALQSMQGGLGEWAKASPFKMPEAGAAAPAAASPAPASPPPAAAPEAAAAGADTDASAPPAGPGMGAVDPLQWWGALTQQFQQIASQAMQDPAHQKAMAAGTQMASDFARNAMQSAADLAKAQAPAEPPQPATPEPAAPQPAAPQPAAPEPAAPQPVAPEPAAPKPAAARKAPRRPS